jgi:hypothetical protein
MTEINQNHPEYSLVLKNTFSSFLISGNDCQIHSIGHKIGRQFIQNSFLKASYGLFMFSDENVGDTLKSFAPKIDGWIKDLLGGFEELNLTRSQKELTQALTVQTMLYNNIMSNEEIIAILSDIIRNIATRHAYSNPLDWAGKRQLFFKSSGETRKI